MEFMRTLSARPLTRSFGAALVTITVISLSLPAAQAFEGPVFRRGMWRFERTLEHMSGPDTKAVLMKHEMTRCVDPTNAMRETFASAAVGNCRSAKPERNKNRYVFAMRCDYLGPVRTEITVESDAAYTETNEVIVGKFPRMDTVVARRIGDCTKAN